MKKYKFVAVILAVLLIGVFGSRRTQLAQAYGLFVDEVGRMAGRSVLPCSVYIEDITEKSDSAEKGLVSAAIQIIYPINGIMKSEFNNLENAKTMMQQPEGQTAMVYPASDQTASVSQGTQQAGEQQGIQQGAQQGTQQGTQQQGTQQGVQQGTQQQGTQQGTQQAGEQQGTQQQGTQQGVQPEQQTGQNGTGENRNGMEEVISHNLISGTVYPKANLSDYNFVYSNFYTVTSITKLSSAMLRPAEFLEKDMRMSHDASTPQILIFHTHSQEDFVDSVEGNPATTIVGVGDYLTKLLQEKYGYSVIHDKGVYDLVEGKLDRSKAYTYSENAVAEILKQNPSIEVVIDLHRDGVSETTHLSTEIDGKKTAKIMFFNGLSYSSTNGEITYLNNPYRDDNLAMSLQLQLLGNAYYPGYLRRIYVNAYRYCLHLRPKSTLIEAGAQTNTVAEVMNAMEPLADLLDKMLRGEKAIG